MTGSGRFHGEVEAAGLPFVGGFGQDGGSKTQRAALVGEAEVEAIEAEAQKAADAITEENADDALKALEAEIDSGE